MKSEHELMYSHDVADAVDSRSLPEVRHVDPTVYGLASVNFCILLTLHVNEVELRARAPELVCSHDVDGYLHRFIYQGGDTF
jgi:hypothetical protein